MTTISIPTDIAELFASDSRITRVVRYDDGWVPNSYRWPAPGAATEYVRQDDGTIRTSTIYYDRKRSYGRGPSLVASSARGGRLVSW